MKQRQKPSRKARMRWVLALAPAVLLLGILGLGAWLATDGPASPPAPGPAPEANKVLAVQAKVPFQILIPAYLPPEFDRANVSVDANESGPSGEPMVQLTYRTRDGATLFVKQWLPGNPSLDILANSRPIETKWGKGWLLTQGNTLVALWSDIGSLRVSTYTRDTAKISRERLVQIANTLGPASNEQVFYFALEQPIKSVAPPPEEIKTNADGVQEFMLVVTPGGYSPLRFAVKKGVPVKLTFRQLGEVGCGNVLLFPADPLNPTVLTLENEHDKQMLEFTPQQAGEFEFHCAHQMYRGVMTVRE